MILTANKHFNEDFETFKLKALIPLMIKQGIKVKQGLDDSELPAFVNHGRWIIKCECGGSEYAWEEGLFMCQSCWNSGHKHNFRKSIFPVRRKEIEALLEMRPLVNRNFLLMDTVEILQAENEDHKSELL